jgi:elongation factor Ts
MSNAPISASLVKELRERTNAAMMDCKKALVEADGDIEKALEILRKSGQAKADKKQGRTAADGLICICHAEGMKSCLMLEVNCETDFVARDENFITFASTVAALALQAEETKIETIEQLAYDHEHTVEQARKALISKIGENINIRRATLICSEHGVYAYNHNGRIGAVVVLNAAKEQVGKDVAMHVAASNPTYIKPEDVPLAILEKEREIYIAQNEQTNKPADLIAKIIDNKVKKFAEETSLLTQLFVKDPNVKVGDYLKQHQVELLNFTRFEVGEGIEKTVANFAEEVMAQVRGA